MRKVIVSGVERTKPSVVQQRITLHPDDPLNQTALLQMQRRLYDLALFNEVNTAIQNPNGDESYKNVLLNLTEAKRWDISYGFGFEVQTGAPSAGLSLPGGTDAVGHHQQLQLQSQRHTGASPRVLFNVSRTNLRGTDQSITLRTNYGTLEQIALLSYQDPHFLNKPSFNLTLSGGYNNSAVITTYRASILSGALAPLAARDQTHHLDLLLFLPPGCRSIPAPCKSACRRFPCWRNRCGWGVRESPIFAIPAMSRSMRTMAPSTPGKFFCRMANSAPRPTSPAST